MTPPDAPRADAAEGEIDTGIPVTEQDQRLTGARADGITAATLGEPPASCGTHVAPSGRALPDRGILARDAALVVFAHHLASTIDRGDVAASNLCWAIQEISEPAAPPLPPAAEGKADLFKKSWQVAESILEYFDSYQLGSVAPIAAEIEKAMASVAAPTPGLSGKELAYDDMSAWDEAAVREAIEFAILVGASDDYASEHAERVLVALAPFLAARDAATWAQACEAMREQIAGKLFSIPEVADRIRTLAPPLPKATP